MSDASPNKPTESLEEKIEEKIEQKVEAKLEQKVEEKVETKPVEEPPPEVAPAPDPEVAVQPPPPQEVKQETPKRQEPRPPAPTTSASAGDSRSRWRRFRRRPRRARYPAQHVERGADLEEAGRRVAGAQQALSRDGAIAVARQAWPRFSSASIGKGACSTAGSCARPACDRARRGGVGTVAPRAALSAAAAQNFRVIM